MRIAMLGCLVAGCDVPFDCVTRDVEQWCYHSEADRGPVLPEDYVPCNPPTVSGELLTDGEYLVSLSSGGFSSVTHYFDPETQEHLATRYSTDVNVYCNDFSYWYGRRLIPRLGGSVDIVPLESAP